MKTRSLLFAAMLLLLAISASSPSKEAEAARLEDIAFATCSQIPSLGRALDYTLNTYPPSRYAGMVSVDTLFRLEFFKETLTADGYICGYYSGFTENYHGAMPPLQTVRDTLMWHFGQASLALREYQQAVGAR